MGRKAIRAAAATYLKSQALPFVGTIFPARPFLIADADYDNEMLSQVQVQLGGDATSRAVLVINLPDSQRERRALSGRSFVEDSNIHDLVLEVFFANRSQDALQAQDDSDSLLDAIVIAVRADPTLGNPGTVWSAGEFQKGVHVTQHSAMTGADGVTIFIISTVRFDAWEWLSGVAGTT